MDTVDNRRRTCLPVFDPFYKPTSRRHRLPLIQQQQQHAGHQPSSEGCDDAKGVCTRTVKISSEVNQNAEDSKPGRTKKLRRVKVVKWKSLNVDSRQRRSNDEESSTKGTQQFRI